MAAPRKKQADTLFCMASSAPPLAAVGHPHGTTADANCLHALPDAPPPRLKRIDFDTDEAFQQSVAHRKQKMAERRKGQERLRDQKRDRSGRARPSEVARKLTPEAAQEKSVERKAAREARAKASRKAKRERQIAHQREIYAERMAPIMAQQAEERAAFMAAAAARVQERKEQKAAAALRAADAAPYPSLHGAPKWWTKTGRSHVSWVAAGCPQFKSGTGYWILGEFVDSIFLTRDQVDSVCSSHTL